MKLIKLLALFLSPAVMALNFSGVGTLSGLNTTRIFTAPASGIYFVKGYLTLPQLTAMGSQGAVAATSQASQVVATVSKNFITAVYTGVAGASGFDIPQLTLVSNDLITVGLSSTATIDSVSGAGINAVRGDVYFGNAF